MSKEGYTTMIDIGPISQTFPTTCFQSHNVNYGKVS